MNCFKWINKYDNTSLLFLQRKLCKLVLIRSFLQNCPDWSSHIIMSMNIHCTYISQHISETYSRFDSDLTYLKNQIRIKGPINYPLGSHHWPIPCLGRGGARETDTERPRDETAGLQGKYHHTTGRVKVSCIVKLFVHTGIWFNVAII